MKNLLSSWPMPRPGGWVERVNEPFTRAETDAVQSSMKRGRPFGDPRWQAERAAKLGLEVTFRPRGRQRKIVKITGIGS
jgi:putative transposase